MNDIFLFMNRFFILFLITISFSCKQNKVEKVYNTSLIPLDAAMIVKFEDFHSWQEKVDNHKFISSQKNNPLFKFWSLENLSTLIDFPDNLILAYNQVGKNNFKKTIIFKHKDDHKLKLKAKQTYQYDQTNIKIYEVDEQTFYLAKLGQGCVISGSKIILENIIRNYKAGIYPTEEIKKLLNVLSDNSPSLVINAGKFSEFSKVFIKSKFPKTSLDLSKYIGFDLNVDEDKILFSGIVFPDNSQSLNWSKFKKIKTEKSIVAEIIPSHFIHASSILISDYEKFISIKDDVNPKLTQDSIWLNIKEIAHIKLRSGNIKALVSKDIDKTHQALQKRSTRLKDFGGTQIYAFKNFLEINAELSNFLLPQNLKYYAIIQDVIIGSDQLKTLEDNIIQVNNQKVLSKQANYNNHINSLSEKSHILWFTNLENQNEFFENQSQEDYQKAFENIDWKDNTLLVSQLIVENNFAYYNILQKQTPQQEKNNHVEQVVRLKIKTNTQNHPQLFTNWRTGQLDVVYQDDNNVLHLIDTKGNLIWSKPLKSPIVGKISSIDIYQNNRIQMAFATQNKVYILDKNGKEVAPFPIDFNDQITQSLSVFDYDNNGKYRFVVVMGNKIKVYDKMAKRVNGFVFKQTEFPVAFPVKHIRTQNKDFILVQENKGKLHILNRRGEARISLDNNFSHKDKPWYEYQNHFISLTNEGELIKIDEKGNIYREEKNWMNPKFAAKPHLLVSMSENQLRINKILKELPYGLYTKPKIINDLIVISDTQTQKTYLIDITGNTINGFPVYARNITDIKQTQNDLLLLGRDESESIIVYRVNFD